MDWGGFTIIVDNFTLTLGALLVLSISFFLLDDLFIDLIALGCGLKPQKISPHELSSGGEKTVAIMIASWQEDNVLEQMIRGNNKALNYSKHHFFLGVYPNDLTTLQIARRLESKYKNVHCIVNPLDGPTSKGQMMNEIVRGILDYERTCEEVFDLFVIHDSEDIIHPQSLRLFNARSVDFDFIQIPIFSIARHSLQLVGGTYMDEFGETHCKDLLVRSHLGASIPSAGVGTCVSRSLVLHLLSKNEGLLLRGDCLTEDYVLGVQAHREGFRCTFLCVYPEGENTSGMIATREFFPSHFYSSVKQKTRWTLGIVFQGWKIMGWSSSWIENYFLYRDRRGPLNAVLTLTSLLFVGVLPFSRLAQESVGQGLLQYFVMFNIFGFSLRLMQRTRYHFIVYRSFPVPVILARWPLAILINASAVFRASRQYYLSVIYKQNLAWSKTHHQLPEEFGATAAQEIS